MACIKVNKKTYQYLLCPLPSLNTYLVTHPQCRCSLFLVSVSHSLLLLLVKSCKEGAGDVAEPRHACLGMHTAWLGSTLAHLAHGLLRGGTCKKKWWGTRGNWVRDCPVQYHCTGQVKIIFFLL